MTGIKSSRDWSLHGDRLLEGALVVKLDYSIAGYISNVICITVQASAILIKQKNKTFIVGYTQCA